MQIQMKCFKMILEGWVIHCHCMWARRFILCQWTFDQTTTDMCAQWKKTDLWGVCIAGFSYFGLETLKYKRVVGLQARFLLSMCCRIFDRIDGHLFGLCKWVTQGGIAAPVTSI